MGHDLDTLLDVTGIGNMAGKHLEKSAAKLTTEAFDLSKIAAECRAAVSNTADGREARGRELVEKTAAVAVISRTVDEINAIIGDPVEKIASSPEMAEFVHAALERGHSPEEVATFLKQAGILDWVREGLKGARAGHRANVGGALARSGKHSMELAQREYGDLLRSASKSGNLNKQQRIVERLRRKLGDKKAAKVLESSGARLHVPAARDLKKVTEGPAASAKIGDKTYNVSKKGLDKAKRYGIPAGAAVGGAAYAGRKKDSGSNGRNGVTVIRG